MRRALGKGLSQLIADQYDGGATEAAIEDVVPNTRQPRTRFDETTLAELSESIKTHGVLQPLLVRPIADGKYELIAGERRLRAARLAGLKLVPIVLRPAGNQNSLELALIENLQREDINAIECARAYRRLIDEFELTQEQVAEKVGKSRTAVANIVRLLRLPKRVVEGLEAGLISEGHGRALLAFENDALQLAMYDQILSRGLTVRDVENAAKSRTIAKRKKSEDRNDPNDQAVMGALSERLGTPAKLHRAEKGGKLVLEFFSEDDLTRILDLLGIQI